MGEFDPAEEARSAGNSGEGEMDGSGGKGPVRWKEPEEPARLEDGTRGGGKDWARRVTGRARNVRARQRVRRANARSLSRVTGCGAEARGSPPRRALQSHQTRSFSALPTALHFPAGHITPHPTMSSVRTPRPWERSPARGALGPCSAGVQEDPWVAAPSGAARAELGAFSAPRWAADRPWDRPPQPRTRRAQRGDLWALRRDARRHRDTWPQLSRALKPPLREEKNKHKEIS